MAVSRNPNGRGCKFPGKAPASFTLCPATKEQIKDLARQIGDSESDFVEGLARTYADVYAQQVLASQEGADGTEDHGPAAMAGSAGADEPPGVPAAGA